MAFSAQYSDELRDRALTLLQQAQHDGLPIMRACAKVADALEDEAPTIERLRKWAKDNGLFPGSHYDEKARTRVAGAVAGRIAGGMTVADASRQVAAAEGLVFETVRSWYYRHRGSLTTGADAPAVRETALELLRAAHEAGVPPEVACTQVADEFTGGPDADQLREWALAEGIYTQTRDDAGCVDLDKFRAEVESPLRAEIDRLRAENNRILVSRSLHRDEADQVSPELQQRVVTLEREKERLASELVAVRALLRHYLDAG